MLILPKSNFFKLLFVAACMFAIFPSATPVRAQDKVPSERFTRESALNSKSKLDAMRSLQARLVQGKTGFYLVRGVRALISVEKPEGVFAYLVTHQKDKSKNGVYELDDFYSVDGYYIVLITREGAEIQLLDELPLTPPELAMRLKLKQVPLPPDLLDDPSKFDYTAAIFDQMNPDVIAWRKILVDETFPRWVWRDMTTDGLLDCILDIEGFEFQPTSYYTVLVSNGSGFEEGFRSWGFDTDFSEVNVGEGTSRTAWVIKSEKHDSSEKGEWLSSWRDYFRWVTHRFVLANSEFQFGYDDIVPSLGKLVQESLDAENLEGGRWTGMSKFAANATRYSEGMGTPFEFYASLARIAEYQGDKDKAKEWWGKVIEYIDSEYDGQNVVGTSELAAPIQDIVSAYEEWRDEIYSSAEAALEED
jgi:hypothetical protein